MAMHIGSGLAERRRNKLGANNYGLWQRACGKEHGARRSQELQPEEYGSVGHDDCAEESSTSPDRLPGNQSRICRGDCRIAAKVLGSACYVKHRLPFETVRNCGNESSFNRLGRNSSTPVKHLKCPTI